MLLSQIQRELQSVRATANEADARLADLFIERIVAWRHDPTTPGQLLADLDRLLGQIRFSRDETQQRVSRLLVGFRPTVDALGGMTMNERLVIFDLADVWDRSSADGRHLLYAKLEARAARPSSSA
jgi:hypothetical protein